MEWMMKKTVAVFLFLALLAGMAQAKDTKIAIIISQRIMDEYPEAQDAQKTLSDEISEWQRQGQQMQDEFVNLQKEYDQQLRGHCSPYTGMTDAADPCGAFVER